MKTCLPLILLMLALVRQAGALDLTVEQCVALGLSDNPVLKAQQAEVDSSGQDLRIARAGFLPTLEARGSYGTLDQPERIIIPADVFGPGFPAKDTEIRGEKDLYAAGFTLRQTLFAGGRITHTYQRDQELLNSARHEFASRRLQLIYDLKRTFYDVLIQQAYAESYAQQVAARQEGLRVAQAMAAEGQLQADQVLQARAKLIFSEAELLQARQRTDNALDQLRRLLGLESAEPLNLIDSAAFQQVSKVNSDLAAEAIGRREDYQQLEARLRAAQESLQLAHSRYLPEVYAEGGYLRQQESDVTRADTWGASVNLNWPLFEGGRTDAEVIKARLEKQRLESLRRDLAAAIRNEVQAAQRQVQQRQLLVEAYLVNLQAEERSYRDLLTRQELGEILAADAHDQKARLLLAQANYRESIHQLRIAIAALEAATASSLEGQLVPGTIYQPAGVQPGLPPETPVPSATTPPRPPAVSDASQVRPEPPGAASPPPAAAQAPHLIQWGAFKSKQRARAFQKSLQRRHPQLALQTVTTQGMFKVRSTPYPSRAAAVTALAESGDEGLIVRADVHDR